MKAVSLTRARTVDLVDVPPPTPAAGQILVKVLACGVCGSDLNAWRGVPGISYPMAPGLPGHEVFGQVAGSDRYVTGLLTAGFAEYALADVAHLVDLPNSDGSILLGEPLACAAGVVHRSRIARDLSAALVGFGYLAALIVQLLQPRPRRWIALSRRASARQLALDLGAEAAYDYGGVPTTLWDSFDVVIEAAGVQETLDYATWLVRPAGRLVVAGYHADGPRTVNMQSWNWKGIDVVNAHERDPNVSLRHLRTGLRESGGRQLNLDQLVTHEWPLDRAAEALAAVENHPDDYVKGVIRPWQ